MKQFNRISLKEREIISIMLAAGSSNTAIAQRLGRSVSTIGKELRRNTVQGRYLASEAHTLATIRQDTSHKSETKIASDFKLKSLIMAKLQLRWSPQQISAWLKENYTMSVSHETIYQYIYVQPKSELRKELISYLRQRKPRRKARTLELDKRGTIPDMISIHERPEEVQDRAVPGHWEGDLIIGKDHKSALGTLVERSTRYVMIVKMKGRDAETVRKQFAKSLRQMPSSLTKTLTYDRGKEMSQHKEFTISTKMQVYFCDPYSPWQRGSNENTNGLIRDFFPKGTDFNELTAKQIKWVQEALNERPRKTLGFISPKDALNQLILKS